MGLRIACLLAAAALVACGDDGGSAKPKGSGTPCAAVSECLPGEVCDPATDRCVLDLSCSEHADCGKGSVCEGDLCAPNPTGGACDDDERCGSGETCIGGFCGCEGMEFQANAVPPNMVIALDRSGSMVTNDVPGTGGMNRWEVAKTAVGDLLSAYGAEIRFGLSLWPGSNLACSQGGSCSPGNMFVDPAEDTATSINDTLADADTCSYGTPITGALNELVGDTRLLDPERSNYVILITDGQQQSCSGDPVAAVTALRAQTPAVQTFVIGFSGDVDADQLEDMAVAAGTARDGDPAYYQADDAAALSAAFADIAGSVLSCDYALEGTPPGDDLYIYFDKAPIDRDTTHADGWDYDGTTNHITFYGAACEGLRSGSVTDLVIVYGCPTTLL